MTPIGMNHALVLAAFFAGAPAASAYEAIEVSGGGTLSGTVRYTKAAEAPKAIQVTKDAAHCGKTKLEEEDLLVSRSKGLANVVVFVTAISKGKAAAPGKARLENRNCRFEPHVQAMLAGTSIDVTNADPILHNTHATLKKIDVFNFGLPEQGQVLKSTLKEKGLIQVGCDAGHTWMRAYLAVFDHPYFAVTDAEGKFSIPDVPPGSYTLAYWHEKLAKKTKNVTVAAGAPTDASLELP